MIKKGLRAMGICAFVGFTYYTYVRIYKEIRTRPREGTVQKGNTDIRQRGKFVKFRDDAGGKYRLEDLETKYTVVTFGALLAPLSLPGTYTLITISPQSQPAPLPPSPASPGPTSHHITYKDDFDLQSLLKAFKIPYSTSASGKLIPQKPYTILLNATSEVVS